MPLVNRLTGKEATTKERAACAVRAQEILDSPYSLPEKLAWALQFTELPAARAWENSRQQAAQHRRQEQQPAPSDRGGGGEER